MSAASGERPGGTLGGRGPHIQSERGPSKDWRRRPRKEGRARAPPNSLGNRTLEDLNASEDSLADARWSASFVSCALPTCRTGSGRALESLSAVARP